MKHALFDARCPSREPTLSNQMSQGRKKSWPDRDSHPGPLAYRASTLPAELPSHLVVLGHMGDLNLRKCLIYLDDIIIFSSTFEEHLERLNAVFKNLELYNLKLKPPKCEFFKNRVVYLGHVVSEDGIYTDAAKTEAVRSWPIPRCTKDVRKFLGFTGYYRRFIEGYAAIARPLNDLLIGHSMNPGAKKKSSVTATSFEWGTK